MSTTLVSDAFTDSNGVAIESHTPSPTGVSWSRTGASGTPDWKIDTNKAAFYPNSNTSYIYLTATGATTPTDQIVKCIINFGTAGTSNGAHGVMLRRVDANNFLELRHNGFEANNLQLVETISGTGTVVKDAAYAFSNSTNYTFELRVSGTSVTAYIDNTIVAALSYTTSISSAGKAGMTALRTNNDTVTYDDFLWTSEDAGGGTAAKGTLAFFLSNGSDE